MAAVSEVTGRIEAPEVRSYGEVKKGFTHFADGDVIWAKITPCMENGKAAVAEELIGGLACGSTEFMVFRSRGALLPAYLHRFLRQESYRKAARGTMQSGVGQARVPKAFVLDSELPVPPIDEQKRIITRIDALQSRADAAKQALDAIPPLLDQLRQSVLAAAFRGDLTRQWREAHPDVEPASELLARIRAERRQQWEKANPRKQYKEPAPVDTADLPGLPDGWCWASFGEVFHVAVGATPSRKNPSFWNGDIPWVSSGEVAFCRIRSTREMITAAGLASSSTDVHPAGTVLLGMIGEGKTRGQPAILDIEACNNQNCAAIRVSEAGMPPEYIYRWLEFSYAQTRRSGAGNSQPALNKSRVQAMMFPVAPLDEQRELVRVTDGLLAVADHCSETHEITGRSLRTLNQSILAKAFRGELVPQDPTDEPASALLDRIRRERAAAAPAPGPKRSKRTTRPR